MNARVIGGLGRSHARPEIAGTCPGSGGVMAWTSFGACSEKIQIGSLRELFTQRIIHLTLPGISVLFTYGCFEVGQMLARSQDGGGKSVPSPGWKAGVFDV